MKKRNSEKNGKMTSKKMMLLIYELLEKSLVQRRESV